MKYIIDLDKLQHEDDICELEYYCKKYGTPLEEEGYITTIERHKKICRIILLIKYS